MALVFLIHVGLSFGGEIQSDSLTSKSPEESEDKRVSKYFAISKDNFPTAQVIFRPAYQLENQLATDPAGNLLNYTDHHGRFYGLFKFKKSFEKLTVLSQLRPRLDYSRDGEHLKGGLDEFYLDYAISDSLFVSAGKRNVFTGVGLGTNSTDYFGEHKQIDNSLSREAIRDQRIGDYMVSLDWFFDSAGLSLFFAPEIGTMQKQQSRTLLRYTQTLADLNSDFSFFAFWGQRPGLGLNFSSTLGDSWVVYSEFSARRGRDEIFYDTGGHAKNEFVADALLGSNYTFDNGVNLIVEYWHKGGGYDRSEWQQLNSLTDSGLLLLEQRQYAQGFGVLAQVNQALKPNYLRQNYLFSRLNYTDSDFGELSLLHVLDLDDTSHYLRFAMEKTFDANYALGFQVEQMLGASRSEFGLRPWSTNFTLTAKISF